MAPESHLDDVEDGDVLAQLMLPGPVVRRHHDVLGLQQAPHHIQHRGLDLSTFRSFLGPPCTSGCGLRLAPSSPCGRGKLRGMLRKVGQPVHCCVAGCQAAADQVAVRALQLQRAGTVSAAECCRWIIGPSASEPGVFTPVLFFGSTYSGSASPDLSRD